MGPGIMAIRLPTSTSTPIAATTTASPASGRTTGAGVFTRSALLREKPVRKGQKHDGMVAFPPLPADVRSFALEVNDFILAFDSNEGWLRQSGGNHGHGIPTLR